MFSVRGSTVSPFSSLAASSCEVLACPIAHLGMKTTLLVAVALCLSCIARADPAPAAPSADRTRETEQRYLAEAREGIERHRKSDAVVRLLDAAGKPVAGARVRVNQKTQAFLFGALSESAWSEKFTAEERDRLRTLFADVFNFTIAKVYWSPYEPTQGRPQWAKLDEQLRWCREQGITVKGHPLAWTHPAGTPNWLLALPDELATRLLQARIYNLVGGYRGTIEWWDVVNEPVTTVPWAKAMQDPANTSEEIASGTRYNVTGLSPADVVPWVSDAYRWAAEANPEGHFILNEFFLMSRPPVRARFSELVRQLLAAKVPVRGLGIQAHEPRDMWFSPTQIKETLDDLAQFGLPLHITEFIPQSTGKPIVGWRSGAAWTTEAQADFAELLYTMAFGHPAVASINWWALSDRDVWLPGGGLLDEQVAPKPAYVRLKKLIKDAWMTRNVELVSGSDGTVRFRGFHGGYDLTVEAPHGTSRTHAIELQAQKPNTWEFRL